MRSGSQPKHFHQLLSVSFVCGASQQAVSSSSNFLATSGSNSLIADHLRTGPRPQKPQKPQSSFHAAGDAIFWSSRCRSSPDLGKRNALGLASTPTPQITATPQPKGSCSAVPPCSYCSGRPRNLNNRQLSKVKLFGCMFQESLPDLSISARAMLGNQHHVGTWSSWVSTQHKPSRMQWRRALSARSEPHPVLIKSSAQIFSPSASCQV